LCQKVVEKLLEESEKESKSNCYVNCVKVGSEMQNLNECKEIRDLLQQLDIT
jgi:hypothetical protein